MSKKMDEEQVAQQIGSAFADAQYPGDDNLVTALDHYDSLKLWLDFKGKHWKEITSELTLKRRFDLSLFTPQAFRFYLPAYLIASLRGDERGEMFPHVMANLDPQEDQGNIRTEFLTKIKPLTSEQKAAVKSFIKLYLETETHLIPDDVRVGRFWETYSD